MSDAEGDSTSDDHSAGDKDEGSAQYDASLEQRSLSRASSDVSSQLLAQSSEVVVSAARRGVLAGRACQQPPALQAHSTLRLLAVELRLGPLSPELASVVVKLRYRAFESKPVLRGPDGVHCWGPTLVGKPLRPEPLYEWLVEGSSAPRNLVLQAIVVAGGAASVEAARNAEVLAANSAAVAAGELLETAEAELLESAEATQAEQEEACLLEKRVGGLSSRASDTSSTHGTANKHSSADKSASQQKPRPGPALAAPVEDQPLGYFEVSLQGIGQPGEICAFKSGPFIRYGQGPSAREAYSLSLQLSWEGHEGFLVGPSVLNDRTSALCDMLDDLTSEAATSLSEAPINALAVSGQLTPQMLAEVRQPEEEAEAGEEQQAEVDVEESAFSFGGKASDVAKLTETPVDDVRALLEENASLVDVLEEQQGYIATLKELLTSSQGVIAHRGLREAGCRPEAADAPRSAAAAGRPARAAPPRRPRCASAGALLSGESRAQPRGRMPRQGGGAGGACGQGQGLECQAGTRPQRTGPPGVSRPRSARPPAKPATAHSSGSVRQLNCGGSEHDTVVQDHAHLYGSIPANIRLNRKQSHPESLRRDVAHMPPRPISSKPPSAQQHVVASGTAYARKRTPQGSSSRRRSGSERRATWGDDDDVLSAVRSQFKTVPALLRAFDQDGDGLVSFPDFRRGLALARLPVMPDGAAERLWHRAALNDLGLLSATHLSELFGVRRAV